MARPSRIEFAKSVKLEMFKRAGGPENLCCEGCGFPLRNKPFEYDHTIEEWERGGSQGERKPLTAADGKLLGYCCHKPKTAQKTAERAHGNRIIEGAARARRKGQPVPGSRNTRWKRKMNGQVEPRT